MKTIKLLLAATVFFMPAASPVDAAAASSAAIRMEQNAQTANPWTDYRTKEAAQKAADIKLKAPDKYFIYKSKHYRAMTENPKMLEFFYASVKGKRDYADTMTIRKARHTGDISGDYTDYEFTKELKVGKRAITVKGNGKYLHAAIWQDGDYAYAIHVDGGLTLTEMKRLIAKIR